MSEVKHSGNTDNNEHGSMKSYVIGFLLSLIFTFIPYYLVVNQTITGTSLLVTIVGFAVIQMIIQITFFLHIGRGPKPNFNLFFFVTTAGIIVFVIVASILIMNRLHYNMAPTEQVKKLINDEGIYQIGGQETGACEQFYNNHIIVINDSQTTPAHTLAGKCDTLTITNEDEEDIEINFGSYDYRLTYAGEKEIIVEAGKSETITLSESGTFQFHNASQPNTTGFFTVNP